jgi:hypothetical protein
VVMAVVAARTARAHTSEVTVEAAAVVGTMAATLRHRRVGAERPEPAVATDASMIVIADRLLVTTTAALRETDMRIEPARRASTTTSKRARVVSCVLASCCCCCYCS